MKNINNTYIDLIPDESKESYLLWEKGRDTIAFSSHQPVLIHLLNTIKKGDVLEFGMGENSTRILHTICGMQGRRLISIDTNKKWFSKFKKYEREWHEMKLFDVDDLKTWEDLLFKTYYSIVFIDGAPAEVRQPFIEHINADYYIVHDTEGVVKGKMDAYLYNFSKFNHVFHFKTKPPMTSVLSNLEEINKEILNIF
jgi:hypothetical protein